MINLKRPFDAALLQATTAVAQQQPTRKATKHRACDWCSSNKRRCDRDDGKACKQCTRRGKPCIFSARRSCKADSITLVFEPEAIEKPKQREQQHRSIALFHDSSEYSRELQSQGHGCKSSSNSSSSSYNADCVQLKRARFSCSPATGLAGTIENSFLATFLTDFSTYMPIVNEQPLRQSLMQLLQPKAGPRSSPVPDQLAASTFWCAIAMGALLQGVPEGTVRHYTRLSSSCSAAESSSAGNSSSSVISSSSSSAVCSVQQVQSALLRACLSSFLGDTLAFVSCTVTAVHIWDSSGGNAEGLQHSSRNGIEFAVRYLNHQVRADLLPTAVCQTAQLQCLSVL
jgi:hypothetical protein